MNAHDAGRCNVRGSDHSDASLDATAAWFPGGEAELEVVRTYRVADLAVTAAIERQRGVVGGLPEQHWSLRVTLVLRRRDSQWFLVHRHACRAWPVARPDPAR